MYTTLALCERSWQCAAQALDVKLDGLMEGVQGALAKASASFRAAATTFQSDLGEKPDWRADPEAFTFWAARWLPLLAREKLDVRPPTLYHLLSDKLQNFLLCVNSNRPAAVP